MGVRVNNFENVHAVRCVQIVQSRRRFVTIWRLESGSGALSAAAGRRLRVDEPVSGLRAFLA
jgi:hypothetical protein